MKLAVVDLETSIVVNIILADEDCLSPDGCFLVNVDDIWCDMDALYDSATNTFTKVIPPAPVAPVIANPDAPAPTETVPVDPDAPASPEPVV